MIEVASGKLKKRTSTTVDHGDREFREDTDRRTALLIACTIYGANPVGNSPLNL